MFILYKSERRVMIVKLIRHRDSSTFETTVREIISTNMKNEWFKENKTASLTSSYIIDQNESLKDLKESMYVSLL